MLLPCIAQLHPPPHTHTCVHPGHTDTWCRSILTISPHGIIPESGGVGGAQASTVSKGVGLCAQSSARASAHSSGENLATNIGYYRQKETFPFSTSLWLRNSLNEQQIQTSHSLQKARSKARHGMPRQGALWGNTGDAPAATVLYLLAYYFWIATHLGRGPGVHLYPGGLSSL